MNDQARMKLEINDLYEKACEGFSITKANIPYDMKLDLIRKYLNADPAELFDIEWK